MGLISVDMDMEGDIVGKSRAVVQHREVELEWDVPYIR